MSEPWPQAGAKDTEHVPTRRMPSDAKMNLWQAELDTLEQEGSLWEVGSAREVFG